MDKEKVGAFIREQRKEQNFAQKDLAEKIHITDKAVSKWERGRNIIIFIMYVALEKMEKRKNYLDWKNME